MSTSQIDEARAELEAAGARQRQIDDLIADEKKELDKIKAGRSRGAPTLPERRKVAGIERRIARLQRGVLPDEPEARPAANTSATDLQASAQQHPQHHAAPEHVPPGRSSGTRTGNGSSAGGDEVGGDASDDDGGSDDEDDVESPDFAQYYSVSSNQRQWNLKVKREFTKGGATVVPPPDLLRSGCKPAFVGLGTVHVCAPHLHMGLPLPPCPRHGWAAVDSGNVHQWGWCAARRVFAETADEWLIGQKLVCDACKAEHDVAQEELDELKDDLDPDGTEVAAAEAAVKAATYTYRSYNPISLQFYAERYYWYVASLPYVVLNRRTAVTRSLARRIMRAQGSGSSNPTDLATELLETKSEWFDLLRAQVMGMHAWAKVRIGTKQPTMRQVCMGEYEPVTHKSVAFCAPGDALIRHFFLAVSDAEKDYKFSWRQQNVGVTVGAIDATFKRGSALKTLKVRQTVWSNDLQAPLVAVFVNSASMDEPAFVAACDDYNTVVRRTGMEPMRLCYIDCTFRDGPGAARRLPSLAGGLAETELSFLGDGGELSLISTVAECDAWVVRFAGDTEVELGFDIEWRAAQVRGSSPGKVATLQIVSLKLGGAPKLIGAIFSLTKLGTLPPSLIGLLWRAKNLAGVGIENDVSKLVSHRVALSDVMAATGPRPPNTTELSPLASDILRLPSAQVSSLGKVFARCCPGRMLNKELVDVKTYNWEKWPLSTSAKVYAINDAYAGALALQRLLHPDRRGVEVPRAAAAARTADGEQAGGSGGSSVPVRLDGDLHYQVFGDAEAAGAEDAQAAGDAAPSAEGEEVPVMVRKTVLEAASNLIKHWDESGCTEPLELPTFLTLDDRAALHAFCEHRGLKHETVSAAGGVEDDDEGEGDDGRRLRIARRTGAANGAPGTSADGEAAVPTGLGAEIIASLPFTELWKLVLTKLDPRHWMGNWFGMSQSKSSSLFKYFCVATSDALFQVWEGERERVREHLRKRFKLGEGVNMADPQAAAAERKRVDELIKRIRRGYWRSRCRFSICEPKELVRRLLAVYYFFRDLKDPETGNDFFSHGHEAICRRELGYVAKGELSDHPTIPLYLRLRELSSGLAIYRCLRTSSGLEGYHQHLDNAVSSCAKVAGLHYTDAVTNEFDWRWTVRAVRVAGLVPSWVRHYNLSLIDYLHDTAACLQGAARNAMAGWRRVRLMAKPLVRHGMHYGMEAEKRPGDDQPEGTEPLRGEAGWVAERLGSPRPLRDRMTAMDVDQLLGMPHNATGQALSDAAFTCGLNLPPAAAERFRTAATEDEAARLALEEANYRSLQQQLRTRISPPATTEAAAPRLGIERVRGGTTAILGPHPDAGGTMQVDAAELSEGEEEPPAAPTPAAAPAAAPRRQRPRPDGQPRGQHGAWNKKIPDETAEQAKARRKEEKRVAAARKRADEKRTAAREAEGGLGAAVGAAVGAARRAVAWTVGGGRPVGL